MPNCHCQSSDYMRKTKKDYYDTKYTSPPCSRDFWNQLPLAMAYVPWQDWKYLYEIEKGFHRGTIFEKLDKPFLGTGGCCK